MTGATHTPGPWVIEAPYLSEIQTEDRLTVASCWYADADGAEITVTGVLPCSLEESAANARLIAAAPCIAGSGQFLLDRLAGFERTVESESGDAAVTDWHGHVAPAIARFRAAISKATGAPT